MMEAKYIIINKTKPVIFNPAIMHDEEANGRNVTSAGFVKIYMGFDAQKYEDTIRVSCYGDSFSLGGIKSKPDTDAKLIKAMLIK